ncbi:carboxypeptidase B [Galendromus occidentalis]|uniref:Carboxypeptidase B n=1 Tax=Galendromus occidentalis TaxID=34638 RepID=A0AAJ7WIF0_9ACAR|nr:carboxypeptidase B [Galendromus occidentalis]
MKGKQENGKDNSTSAAPNGADVMDGQKKNSGDSMESEKKASPTAQPPAGSQVEDQTPKTVPDRYSNAVEPLIAEGPSTGGAPVRSPYFKVRGASRQFGAAPEVEPFTPELLLEARDQHKTYENYKVYRVRVESRKQEQYLSSLDNDFQRNISLWEDPIIDRNVTLIAPPQSVKSLEDEFDAQTLKYSVLTENLKTWLDEERENVNPNLFLEQNDIGNFKLDTYHTLDEISSYLDLLAMQYPNLVKPIELGRTYENNTIKGVVLSTGGQKRAIYIDAGTHAREWISVASLLYILSNFISNGDTDPELKSLLDQFEFHFVPVINSDGYKYTWNGDRLWRKNRVRFQGFYWCSGVDPNRNFNYYWGSEGASANPCSETYRGTRAFSELETRAIRDYIGGIKDRLSLYLSLHAYGQYLLLPFGTGPSTLSSENKVQMAAAGAFRDAIMKKTGQTYKIGSSKQILYAASGLSNDWVHSQGVTHAYVAELRDTGSHGFVLPPEQILPAAEEVFEGIKALIKFIATNDLNTQRRQAIAG